MSKSRITLPARKMMVQGIQRALPSTNDTGIADLQVWSLNNQQFAIIWIQGNIIQVSDDSKSFLIDDGTAIAEVFACDNVPAGCPSPRQDRYMMVIGEVLMVEPRPGIKAMKLQDLTGDPQASALWPLEVQDADIFLANPNSSL